MFVKLLVVIKVFKIVSIDSDSYMLRVGLHLNSDIFIIERYFFTFPIYSTKFYVML